MDEPPMQDTDDMRTSNQEMKRIAAAMEKLVTSDAVGEWLTQPNPAFDGSTPQQVIERGETDRVWRMIYELQSGQPG